MSNNEQTKTAETINIFASLKTKTPNDQVTLTVERQKKLSTLTTKSAMIRFLSKEGYKTGQIANILGIKYQHVFNVLNTVTKKS